MANPVQDFGGLISVLVSAYSARFGDVEKDVLVVEDLEQLLADVGVPDAGLALVITEALNGFVRFKIATTPAGGDPGQYWFYHAGPTIGGR